MTKRQILDRLIEIGKTGARNPFIVADRVDQEDLYDIQEKLTSLIADLADKVGNSGVNKVMKAFPYLFKVKSAGGQ